MKIMRLRTKKLILLVDPIENEKKRRTFRSGKCIHSKYLLNYLLNFFNFRVLV